MYTPLFIQQQKFTHRFLVIYTDTTNTHTQKITTTHAIIPPISARDTEFFPEKKTVHMLI